MTVATVATAQTKKLVMLGISLFRRTFNAPKCKTAAKMAVSRIKLLRNKREVVVKQMRRDIALLLQAGQDVTARIRVEHVMREQNILAANEVIELFCELLVSRLSIISKRRECPTDLKEGIDSLIFAAPRCSEIPELVAIRDVFEKKYGRDFVSAATDLRPGSSVNRTLIDKLSVRPPTGEMKLKIMSEIAKEHKVEWDTEETEKELLKPPEKTIEGPRNFVSAASFPLTNESNQQAVQPQKLPSNSSFRGPTTGYDTEYTQFENAYSAAIAAAKSANEAIAAAKAAAYHANKDSSRTFSESQSFGNNVMKSSSFNLSGQTISPSSSVNDQYKKPNSGPTVDSPNFDEPNYPSNVDRLRRRHSCNAGITFDRSDSEEDYDEIVPPQHPPPRAPPRQPLGKCESFSPCVHPNLPDYDTLAARFEALKHHRKSLP